MRKRNKTKTTPPRVPPIPRETLEIAERRELLICGVNGIGEYSRETIRILTAKGEIAVVGEKLTLCWAGERRLMLRGEIGQIVFEKRK